MLKTPPIGTGYPRNQVRMINHGQHDYTLSPRPIRSSHRRYADVQWELEEQLAASPAAARFGSTARAGFSQGFSPPQMYVFPVGRGPAPAHVISRLPRTFQNTFPRPATTTLTCNGNRRGICVKLTWRL